MLKKQQDEALDRDISPRLNEQYQRQQQVAQKVRMSYEHMAIREKLKERDIS